MEHQTAAPGPERRALSLAEAADAIAGLPDDVLGISEEGASDIPPGSGDGMDSTSGWTQAEEFTNDAVETAEAPQREAEDDPLVTVTLPDGEAGELPLSEVVRGYSRVNEHERKAAELAQEREQLQQVQEQFARELERWLVAQALDAPPAPELVQQDPAEYGRQQAAWQQRAAAREAVLQHYDAMKQQHGLEHAGRVEQERQRLREAWPEIADPKIGPRLREDIYHGMAEEYGFSAAELDGLYNHRTVLMARDALAYRRMRKANPGAQARPREWPVMMKPSAKQGRSFDVASRFAAKRERLRRHGTLRDAAAVFEDMEL